MFKTFLLFSSGDLQVCYINNMTSCSNPSYPFTCGDMFCAKDSETCGLYMTEIAMESLRVGLSQGLGGDICATMNI